MPATPALPEESKLDKALRAITTPFTPKRILWERASRWMPRLLKRAIELTWTAVTSFVPKISTEHLRRMLVRWGDLSEDERKAQLEKGQEGSQRRRTSIVEITSKASIVLSGTAGFVGIMVFALPNAKGAQAVWLVAAAIQFFISVVLVAWMSSPKLKVWLYKPDRLPAGLQQLENFVADKKFDAEHPDYAGFTVYQRVSDVREERDIKLLVDRRMLELATFLYAGGALTVFIYFFKR